MRLERAEIKIVEEDERDSLEDTISLASPLCPIHQCLKLWKDAQPSINYSRFLANRSPRRTRINSDDGSLPLGRATIGRRLTDARSGVRPGQFSVFLARRVLAW